MTKGLKGILKSLEILIG